MTIDPHLPVKVEQVGLVMVHGIGEQGRFEHLDGHTHVRGDHEQPGGSVPVHA